MKNRILFLNENPLPKRFVKGTISGKELRLRAACKEIDEVHAIALPGKVVETNDKTMGSLERKIFVHLTIGWPYYLAPIILFFYGLYYVWKLRPKVVEAESPILSGVAAVVLGKLFNLPTLVEVRASYEELIKMKLTFVSLQLKKVMLSVVQKWVLTNATIIVANSKTYQKSLEKMGFESEVINPGLQYPPKRILKKKQAKIIGYLGRLVPEKGVDYLLRACKLIEKDLVAKGWSVEIAGDGPEREKLENLAKQLFENSQLKVRFLGFVDNYQTLSRFALLVNPCLAKAPLEMVNVEAAYMGVPVVCFGDENIPETVVDEETGLKVKKQSPELLAKAILEIINKNLGKFRYDRLVVKYAFERQKQTLERVYQRCGCW